jgi:tripartite-type tricarboxylate transporter receptor subunit TctC
VNRLLQEPAMMQRLGAMNFPLPAPTKTPEQLAQTIREDIELWTRVIKTADIKPTL